VGSEETGEGQLGYYRRKATERALQFQKTNRLGTLCLWLGMFTAVFLFLLGGTLTDFWFNVLLAFMGILPLIAGVREAYAFKKADRELVKQYQFMAQTFARAKQKLIDTPDA
jgi:Na+/citrate or Na+/malate symporter